MQVGLERKLQIQELEEICRVAYDSVVLYKERTKMANDRMIKPKEFKPAQEVLLYHSRF